MIKTGKIVVIGDEVMALVASAAGLESYVFNGNCTELYDWLVDNASSYDVLIYLDDVVSKCAKVKNLLSEYAKEKIVMVLEHPLRGKLIDPRKPYKELANRILGIEVEL